MAKKSVGSAKRFGTRYGKTNKLKVMSIENQYKKPQKCPYCNKMKVKRLATGIFQCDKCLTKFAAKAYVVA